MTDNPEFRKKVDGITATLDRMTAAVPEAERPAFEALLKSADLNIAGSGPIDVFASFLGEIDKSEGLSAETRTAIREAVYKEHYVRTGSDVRDSATATRIDENGETVPVYTAERPKPVRPGVTAYSETGEDVIVRLDLPGHPPVIREVTGWSDDDIGLLTEAMGLSAAYEAEGLTGFVESVYEIDFAVLGKPAFDHDSLRQIRQMLSALMGTFEGYDGKIFDARAKTGLIHHQAQLLSPDGRAFGTEESQSEMTATLKKLGLRDAENRMNMEVLRAFGAYAQTTFKSGEADFATLQAYLFERFPQFVAAPDPLDAAA